MPPTDLIQQAIELTGCCPGKDTVTAQADLFQRGVAAVDYFPVPVCAVERVDPLRLEVVLTGCQTKRVPAIEQADLVQPEIVLADCFPDQVHTTGRVEQIQPVIV